MRTPVRWNQYWIVSAVQAGVRFVDGDYYSSAHAGSKGLDAYYSEKFGCWIRYNPLPKSNGGKAYRAAEATIHQKVNAADKMYEGIGFEPWPGDKGYTQAELKAEYQRLEKLGYGGKEHMLNSQEAFDALVKKQPKEPPVPVVPHPVEEATAGLRQQVWEFYEWIISNWRFEDVEKGDMLARLAAMGVFPPEPESKLVQLIKPVGMTEAQFQEAVTNSLSPHKIEVSEIS